MIEERVIAYFAHNNRIPAHILFYRDGVSESQFGMVKLEEVPLIRQGCNNAGLRCHAGPDWCPPITLLVVGKRHHSRFYPINPGPPRTPTANFWSGLVVDRTVTSPERADFYLQSHDSALGSAKSAHYVVIENESRYTMDEFQELVSPTSLPSLTSPLFLHTSESLTLS
jgi:eukaryotic translation initiation factor 2C